MFGHPLGLTWLFTTEMAERFSYYGMRAILVLYLTNYLLLHPTVDHVIGYQAIKGLFEFIFNGGHPLGVQPFSSLIYGNYTAFVFLTPFFGGLIADNWIGQRYSVIIGGVIMADRRIHTDDATVPLPGTVASHYRQRLLQAQYLNAGR